MNTWSRRSRKALATCVTALGLALIAGPASAATLYKWVDADGNVTYQDTPPPGNVEFEANEIGGQPEPLPEGTGNEIEEAALDNPVSLYTVPACDTCDLVRLYLERNSIPFAEKNVRNNIDLQKELEGLAGDLTVPTLIIGDRVLDGYSRAAIGSALSEAGFPVASATRQAQTDGSEDESGDGFDDQSTDLFDDETNSTEGLEPLDLNASDS